ncbi:hypothetical protein VTH06DRAFT_6092 [Thermothelomyces fergusii]
MPDHGTSLQRRAEEPWYG